MVEAVVEFDYVGQESDELTIRKGDVIREVIKKPGGWWEGTLREKRGMFPDNFVTVIFKEKGSQRQKPSRALRQCRAVFSYHPAHGDELSLTVGDIIDVIGEVEEGWWKGRIGDSEGVFPSNFVAELDSVKSHSKHSSKEDLTSVNTDVEGIPNLPPKPSKIICQVKYPYEACNEDELTLREGDLISLISKDGQDRGWWRGELHGRIGVFPDNFVTLIPTPEMNGPPQHKQSRTEKVPPVKNLPDPNYETPKTTNIAAHRKSLDLKSTAAVPPIPGKKPNVPKKSPSAVGGSSVMAGIKQKFVDMVDGAASSRVLKHDEKEKESKEKESLDFDQVERSAMLQDMRANRAKAPGRRPPSTVYRDNELVNGNDHVPMPEIKSESSKSETSNDEDESEKKPKVREWEKNRAPWVAELKQSQAKRTSNVPSSTPNTEHTRVKLTPTNDKTSPEVQEISDTKLKSPITHDTESSPVDMSKSMSALSTTKIKSIDSEFVILRNKSPSQPITITPVRPQSIHASTSPLEATKVSPIVSSHSPISKPPIAEKTIESKTTTCLPRSNMDKKTSMEFVSIKQYMELADKVLQMETRMQQKMQEMQSKIEELQGKLQIESDKRLVLQDELQKVAQCVTQV